MDRPDILVLDTIENIQQQYTNVQNETGYKFRFANDSESALRMILETKPHIVLIDIDAIPAGAKLVPHLQSGSIPIMWVSQFNRLQFEDLPIVARILNKPFRGVDLKIAIRSVLIKDPRMVGLF